MPGEAFTLVQISDTHLDPANQEKMARVEKAIHCALDQHPDLIVHSGDISDNAYQIPGAFDPVKRVFDHLTVPWHVIPGNHDVGEPDGEMVVRESWLDQWHKTFQADRFVTERGRWRLIGINTQIVASALPAEADQLAWLDEQLDTDMNVAVFMHQPPFVYQPDEQFGDKSDYWAIRERARPQFMQRLSLPNVKLVANGHCHWYRSVQVEGHHSVWCPSTDIVVDDAKFPTGGDCFGIIVYRFTGDQFTDELIKLDVPWNYYGFNRPIVEIPGRDPLRFDQLVLDFTGTLSTDGQLLDGVADRIRQIARTIRVHVCTADTFGTAAAVLSDLPLKMTQIQTGRDKQQFLGTLGTPNVIAIGNGRNDVDWLRSAAVGIAIIGDEGAASEAVRVADVVVNQITDALDLVLHPTRLKATLRD